MPWFKVDDAFADHSKVAKLQDDADDDIDALAAVGLWVLAGVYSMRTLTDGRLSPSMLRKATGATQATLDRMAGMLVDAGLWERDGDMLRFHDWLAVQPSAESVRDRRTKAAERKRRSRSRVTAPTVRPGVTPESRRDMDVTHGPVTPPPDPDPDPDPSPCRESAAARARVARSSPDPSRPGAIDYHGIAGEWWAEGCALATELGEDWVPNGLHVATQIQTMANLGPYSEDLLREGLSQALSEARSLGSTRWLKQLWRSLGVFQTALDGSKTKDRESEDEQILKDALAGVGGG